MPIFEYYSPQTHRIYSFFARGPGMGNVVPRCPDDPAAPMQKVVSSFAVTRKSAAEAEGGGQEGLDDPRMEQMMAEMEREMAGVDEENPDPRQMARMMRRMSEMTGEKIPASMEEMIRRLEAGEDPEKVEEAMGDLDEADEFLQGEAGGMGEEEGGGGAAAMRRLLRGRQRAAERDPALYELSEYIDQPGAGL